MCLTEHCGRCIHYENDAEYGDYGHCYYSVDLCNKHPGYANLKSFPFKNAPKCFEDGGTIVMKYPEYEDLQEFLDDLAERGWDSWKTPEEKQWRNYCAKEAAKQFAIFVKKEREAEAE